MIQTLKQKLYFLIALYFKFFAKIRLSLWQPHIIVVTGSNGKTTLLHLLAAQIGNKAKYSYHANSAFGISFDILGLKRNTFLVYEWVYLFIATPFKLFSPLPREKIYIVEADCDRPGEGKFLAELLKPQITVWLSSEKTHSMNFDVLVKRGKFSSVEDAIACEYGFFIEKTKKLVILNGDLAHITKQNLRTKAQIIQLSLAQLKEYQITTNGTSFTFNSMTVSVQAFLPKEVFYALAATYRLLEYLSMPLDTSFIKFIPPPGRSSIFQGIKGITLLDSSYNANLASMAAILTMLDQIPGTKKWVVLGDMLEQGKNEQQEHEKLAREVAKLTVERVILLGPRNAQYTYPKLKKLQKDMSIKIFLNPREVLDYLLDNLKGSEIILFKGGRFLEGVIEHLLMNKADAEKLCRREKVWQIRRRKWNL